LVVDQGTKFRASCTGHGREIQNGIYRFGMVAASRIPLFPERNCNRLRALAIVVLRGRIAVFLEENGQFGVELGIVCNQEVAGSIPVGSTRCKFLPKFGVTVTCRWSAVRAEVESQCIQRSIARILRAVDGLRAVFDQRAYHARRFGQRPQASHFQLLPLLAPRSQREGQGAVGLRANMAKSAISATMEARGASKNTPRSKSSSKMSMPSLLP
jgi:hypothetical protein